MASRFNFRAWDVKHSQMLDDFYLKNERIFDWYGDMFEEVENAIIMQSTGLLDANGKEIFEGDIVLRADKSCHYLIEWASSIPKHKGLCFSAVCHAHEDCWKGVVMNPLPGEEWEVIGNFYEDSALLKR